MPCQGDVGLGKIRSICSSSCNEWFDSCREEYYMSETIGGSLLPCYGDPIVCARLDTIVKDGEQFCRKMGFRVQSTSKIKGKNDDGGDDDDNDEFAALYKTMSENALSSTTTTQDDEDASCYDGSPPLAQYENRPKKKSRKKKKKRKNKKNSEDDDEDDSEFMDMLQTVGFGFAALLILAGFGYFKGVFGRGRPNKFRRPPRMASFSDSDSDGDDE